MEVRQELVHQGRHYQETNMISSVADIESPTAYLAAEERILLHQRGPDTAMDIPPDTQTRKENERAGMIDSLPSGGSI